MHRLTRPFEVVFLTNFSDACFRAIPALAQLADEIDLRLTIVHADADSGSLPGDRTADLRSFFAEADRYPACRRLVIPGTPLDAVRQLQHDGPIDLIVSPAGDPLGLPRLSHSSLRSRLIRDSGVPLWTFGRGASARRLARRVQSLACVVDVSQPCLAPVHLAGEYASRLNASLRFIRLVPDIDDSSLLLPYMDWSLTGAHQVVAEMGLSERLAGEAPTTDRRGLARVLADCDADLVFLDGRLWITRQWLARRVSPDLDALPCPAICVDGARRHLASDLLPTSAGLSTVPTLITAGRHAVTSSPWPAVTH